MAYDNEKKFALFKNDKGDNPKRPDYRGEITLNGAVYKMSAWLAEDHGSEEYHDALKAFKTTQAAHSNCRDYRASVIAASEKNHTATYEQT